MLKTQESTAPTFESWRQLLEESYQGRQTYEFSKGFNIPLYSNDVWIVCRGVVQLSTLELEGQESILGLACPDMSFGLPITQVSPYEAVALTHVVLMRIQRKEIGQSPLLTQGMLMQLHRRLEQTEALLAITHHRHMRDRIEQLLVFLQKEVGEVSPEGIRIWVRFTHQQIANLASTNRVTVSRILGDLRKEGRLSIDETRHMVVHNSAGHDFQQPAA